MTSADTWSFTLVGDPRLSPDGREVVWTEAVYDEETDARYTRLWSSAFDDISPRLLTDGPRDGTARWSPDGQRLAFLRPDELGRPQLWLCARDGGGAKQLTSCWGGAQSPTWSPDGRRLAFLSHVEAAGEQVIRCGHLPVSFDHLPVKTADGSLVTGARSQLHVVELAGGGVRQLTSDEGDVQAPAWSPDGRHLAFLIQRLAFGSRHRGGRGRRGSGRNPMERRSPGRVLVE